MDIEIARTNMLKQQLRTSGVVSSAVLELFDDIPRQDFVPRDYHNLAYADANIPLDHQQVMLSPVQEAHILKAVAIQPHEKVLEIGTGTGYFTTLLAKLADHVTSVDIFRDFTEHAQKKLAALSVKNVSLHTGNGATGWGSSQFDVIVVSGALPFLPQSLIAQLAPGGRLFAVVGNAPAMVACLMSRLSPSELLTRSLFETNLPVLIDAVERESFNF